MNSVQLQDGMLSINVTVEEARKLTVFFFGLEESPLSGMLCKVGGDPQSYSHGINNGDKVFVIGEDDDGDAVVLLLDDENDDNPLVQALHVEDLTIL